MDRRFVADAPNRLWVADITYIRTFAWRDKTRGSVDDVVETAQSMIRHGLATADSEKKLGQLTR